MKKLLLVVLLLSSVGVAYAFDNHSPVDWSQSTTSHHSSHHGNHDHGNSCHDHWFF